MTSHQYNDRLASAEIPEERPVKLTPTTIEEIRAKRGRPLGDPPTGQKSPLDQVARLVERVERLEAGLEKRETVSPEDLAGLLAQVKDLSARLESIMSTVHGTVGFGARQSFTCRNCQSRGYVAARLNCTSCGEENWWGWWPQKQ